MIRQVGNGAVRQFCEVTEDPETPPPGHAPPHTAAKVLYRKTLLLVFIFVKMVYSIAIQKKNHQTNKKKPDLLSKYWFKAYSSLLPPTQASGWSAPVLRYIHLEGYCTYPTTTDTVHCQRSQPGPWLCHLPRLCGQGHHHSHQWLCAGFSG